jgi:RNA polymerase sigma-70 factor (ECF subfamily)
LTDKAVRGDVAAAAALCERFRPRLVAWTRGRLPDFARDLLETEDLVQDAILSSLRNLESLRELREESFLAYVMQSVRNRIVSEIRRVKRRPVRVELEEGIVSAAPTPIEELLSRETEAIYLAALGKLSAEEKDLVIGRFELQMSNAELAIHVGKASPDAARMAAVRATKKLLTLMQAALSTPTPNEPERSS